MTDYSLATRNNGACADKAKESDMNDEVLMGITATERLRRS
ncbi:hypothetical protein ACFIOY_20905 [Bradyrhizobium sp. TZ2]